MLRLFGVPYILAPTEAEAQCAFLDSIDLTDGTITDDSDIWLFGGRTVYKNFFNFQKHVLEYRDENIQHIFSKCKMRDYRIVKLPYCILDLTRDQMILLALLVGSDYTLGLQGVGPVTALEILGAFPPKTNNPNQILSGLSAFKSWIVDEKIPGPAMRTLRSKLKNVAFFDSFPSEQVVKAYLEPTVDESRECFSWSKPDIMGLIDFAKEKFGWTQVKSMEMLKPVIKRMEETTMQKSIKDFFKTKHKITTGTDAEDRMSKRVKQAVKKIGGSENPKDEENSLASDEDVKVLQRTRVSSKKKVKEIKKQVVKEIKWQETAKPSSSAKLPVTRKAGHKEVIPQRERDKVDMVKSKTKAIEVYRKSEKRSGRNTVKRKNCVVESGKSYLSESSMSE